MKFVFMGSGEFGAIILQYLLEKHDGLAVITTEEELHSKKITTPVINISKANNIPHITTKSKTELPLQTESLKPDVLVVASFGLIIPPQAFEIGKFPPLNIHPSTLPRWRGAAPIERSIEAGDKTTSICIMQVVKGLDEGNVFAKQNIQISEEVMASELKPETAKIGSHLLLDVLGNFEAGILDFEAQTEEGLIYAKKIKPEELLLNLTDEAEKNYNKIRAFDLAGGAYFTHKEERIKIWKATIIKETHQEKPGTLDFQNGYIYCKNGIIKPTIMQRQSKKMVSAEDFWRGLR